MTSEKLEKRTTINVQEKATLIWAIADKIVNVYKTHEYSEEMRLIIYSMQYINGGI